MFYSQEKHPIDRATKVADDFKNLRNDIQDFSTAFMNYIEEQKQQLTEDAEQFEKDIRKHPLAVDGCVVSWFTLWGFLSLFLQS